MLWVNGHLLHRLHKSPDEKEKEAEIFCNELDPNTLKVGIPRMYFTGTCAVYTHVYMYLASHIHTYTQPCRAVSLSCQLPESAQTLQLMSDGLYVYWLYYQRTQDSVTHPVSGEKVKQFPVFIHQLQVHVLGCWLLVGWLGWLCNCTLNSCIILSISTWYIKYMYIHVHLYSL